MFCCIRCPYCGDRDQIEFGYGGEAHIVRPHEPEAISDAQWADYVFMRTNTKGLFAERWVHSAGCRRWFNALARYRDGSLRRHLCDSAKKPRCRSQQGGDEERTPSRRGAEAEAAEIEVEPA